MAKVTVRAQQIEVTTFPKVEIIENSKRLFNKAPEVVAGALYDVNEAITIEDARERLDNYLTRPINNEGGK